MYVIVRGGAHYNSGKLTVRIAARMADCDSDAFKSHGFRTVLSPRRLADPPGKPEGAP